MFASKTNQNSDTKLNQNQINRNSQSLQSSNFNQHFTHFTQVEPNDSTNSSSSSSSLFRVEFHMQYSDTMQSKAKRVSNNSEYTCCGWWELIVLRRVPNDLIFHSIGISLLENDDLSSVSQRIVDVLKDETNEKDLDLDTNKLWFREIPDGVNIQRLRHYLLTPGVRFMIISETQDDIQTFVLRSAFKHWIKGLSPFRREYVWPLLFESILQPQFRPSYITDDNNAWKILQGSETVVNEIDDEPDDEKTEPHRKLWHNSFNSLPKRIDLVLNPHELETLPDYCTDIEISSPSSSEQTSDFE